MRTIQKILTTLLIAATCLTSCVNSGSSQRQKTPEELRMELKQEEKANPTKYLSADGTYKENFWGDKFNLKCTITNKASIATFKDAVLRVTYYTKTKTALGTKDYTVYELFPPTSSKEIELKINNYKDVSTIGLEILKAIPVKN